ncbi:MAG: glutathione peroxidase [Bifidobacterium sp.]|jgi:glutathione peroxidase|nr:glutathione peroxidase [Bifidobacterium sp.]
MTQSTPAADAAPETIDSTATAATIYDFTVTAQDGSSVSLSDYRGKVLLVVNTATGCGFTPQYEGLEALYKKYKDRGFAILDFPCNQFAGQAPGTNEEIHEFCVGRFAMTFPQFSKINVNGKDADPLYVWLKSQQGGVAGSRIKWNFTKFLIDRDGHAVARFASQTTPEELDSKVAALL